MDGVRNSETTSKTRLFRSEITSIKRDKTTNSIPSQKADHLGSSQNKKSYASSLNGDRDSKVEKQVTAVKGNTLSNVPLTPSLITPALVLVDSCIGKKWGETMDIKENLVSSFAQKWLCIKTKQADNILEKFKVIFKGKVYMARAKELFIWTSIFLDHKESEYVSDDESLHGTKNKSVGSQHGEDDLVDDSDVEGVSETFFGDKHPSPNNSVCNNSEKVAEQQSEDPFCIYDVLNKKPKGVAQDSDSSLSHPPGFTPEVSRQENDHRGVDLNTETDKVNSPLVHTKVMNNSQKVHENVTSNGESAFNYSHNAHNGGSILEVLDDMIRVVKDVFKDHFATRFKQPVHGRLKLNISFLNRLSTNQVANMDRSDSRDEIRVAVWNCGENKSPGPDGYTFEFFRRYWRFDPKVTDGKFVTDFRPISLIGCVYKVVTKILANRLATVISDLVFDIQSAFVANRQILDGPFTLNELLAWCKRKKKQAMIFKVNFAKAYDSVRWDYLLDVLQAFGFGPNCIQKSQVLGVGVPRNIANQAASLIGCAIIENPFRYLGVMVGDSMSQKLAWADTVQKLRSRLSKWKVWRFPFKDGSLWYRVIQALYCASFELHPVNQSSIWCSILREMQALISKGFDFVSHCKKRVRDGHNTRFWYDSWVFNQPLRVRFPRLFGLETDKESTVASKLGSSLVDAFFRRSVRDGVERQQWDDLNSVLGSVTLSASKDRWICDLNGDGVFRVKEVRTILDDIFLPSANDATRWVKYIPIKINVFAWRAQLDRLPTRSNLVRRGVVLDSSLCPLCGLVLEDIHHVLFRCDTAKLVFRRICHWWDLDWHDLLSFSDWNAWFSAIWIPSRIKLILEGVFYVALWHLWVYRNKSIFVATLPRRSVIFDDIVSRSFSGALVDVIVLFLGRVG
nr:RNA-directed DNA polymerase, eukaryota [Tanacetum cinerariifolium]